MVNHYEGNVNYCIIDSLLHSIKPLKFDTVFFTHVIKIATFTLYGAPEIDDDSIGISETKRFKKI